jgi:hypothetical protein
MQGHGRTADSERPFSYASLADDVAGVLKHLGIGKADVLGYCRAVPTDILHSLARVVVTPTGRRDRLGGVERREGTVDDHPMPTMARPQQRYDYRLRNLVQRTGDVTVATNLGVPRSTARGWLGAAPTVVVCLDVADLTEPQLRQEVLKLGRRVQKLAALLRLAVSLLRTSGFSLNGERLPDGRAKNADPARRGSGPRVPPVANGLAVPADVTESVPCLAPAATRVWARRSILLSPHITVPADAPRGPGDQGHGHLD